MRRAHDVVVPLIAVDDLPSHVIIQGIPRTVEMAEFLEMSVAGGVTCVGGAEPSNQTYVVERVYSNGPPSPPEDGNQNPATPILGPAEAHISVKLETPAKAYGILGDLIGAATTPPDMTAPSLPTKDIGVGINDRKARIKPEGKHCAMCIFARNIH